MSEQDPRADGELLLATRDDIEAFGVFYRRHARWVLGFCARRLGDSELAADVTSEVFAAAMLASGRYDPARGEAHSWLFGIVTNQLGSAVRRGAAEDRARRQLQMQPVDLGADDIAWIEALAAADDPGDVMGALSALPIQQRALIAGRVIEERSYRELAGEHQLSQATVRKRVSRGLATLRARLTEGDRER